MTLIGIVGFGHLGQAIYEYAKNEAHLEIAWVWNRSISKLLDIPEEYMLEDLDDIDDMPLKAELIVEVAHPSLWKDHAETLLSRADVVIGSPSGLSVKAVEDNIRRCCQEFKHTAFVARGALWGGEDIFRMVDTVKDITITMKKHPSHLRVHESLAEKMSATEVSVLYEGPVRDLCPLAPLNVNTMATLSLFSIGFDRTVGRLVSDPNTDKHTITVVLFGTKPGFSVTTTRANPASTGHVTGKQTYVSFLNSLDAALVARRINNLQLC